MSLIKQKKPVLICAEVAVLGCDQQHRLDYRDVTKGLLCQGCGAELLAPISIYHPEPAKAELKKRLETWEVSQ